MSNDVNLLKKNMSENYMALIALNVGDGDAIIIKFPKVDGKKVCAVVDCYNADKTIAALKKLKPDYIRFICASHPHYDHNKGLKELIEWCDSEGIKIKEFWDSGFRHVSKTHYNLINLLQGTSLINLVYPTSGYECTVGKVGVKVLSPSIHLKNRYDTFGININNASIVLKIEYPHKNIAKWFLSKKNASENDLIEEDRLAQNTLILGGDAQFDAWAKITDEFPKLIRTENRGQMIDPDLIKHNPLKCQVLKVPHHMSKHGISLEVLEIIKPIYTIASCSNSSKHGFPHELTVMAVEDIHKKKKDKGMRFTGHREKIKRSGTIVAIFKGGSKRPLVYKLGEMVSQNAPLPQF